MLAGTCAHSLDSVEITLIGPGNQEAADGSDRVGRGFSVEKGAQVVDGLLPHGDPHVERGGAEMRQQGDVFQRGQFRRDLRSKVKKLKPGFEKLLPDGRSEPTRADYTVVFGIMREPLKDGSLNLPFFSMVSLKTAAERLQQMGYKVAINLIEKRHAVPLAKAA